MLNTPQNIGFGSQRYRIAVYIGNQPTMVEYQQLNDITALCKDEIAHIVKQCGNGWRKVFNVYAKLLYALDQDLFSFTECAPTWQTYRDNHLLQSHGNVALLFSAPILTGKAKSRHDCDNVIHIIMGKTYAKSLVNTALTMVPLTWLDEAFAINKKERLIVCPYFDYRQLSNSKIERLATLMKRVN